MEKYSEVIKNFVRQIKNGNYLQWLGLDPEGKIPQKFTEKLFELCEAFDTHEKLQAQNQEKINTQAKFINTVLSSLPSLISYMDKNLNYLYVNNAYESWFGVSKEVCLKSNMTDIVGEKGVSAVREYLNKAYAGEKQDFEIKLPYKQGLRWIHVQYIPDFNIKQEVIGIIVIVDDITQRKEKEIQYRQLFDLSPLGIIKINDKYEFLSANKAYEQIVGYTETELKNLNMLDVTHPDDRTSSDSKAKSISIQDAVFKRFEKRYVHKSGQINWVRITSRNITDDSGNITYLSIIEDITQLKLDKLETEIAFETMSDGFIIQNDQGYIERSNSSALNILSLSTEELIGKKTIDPNGCAVKENKESFLPNELPNVIALKENRIIKNIVMGLILPNNEERWINLNSVPFENLGIRKVLTTFSDITKLVKLNSDIKMIFSTSRDLISITGVDGYAKKINPTFTKLLGWSEEEFFSRPYIEFFHPEDLEKTKLGVEQLHQGIPLINFENRLKKKDGGYVRVSWMCEPDIKNGYLYVSGRDITEQKEKDARNQEILNAIESSALVSFTDIDGKIIRINKNFSNVSGYSAEELIGQDHRIINSHVHSKTFFSELWATISAGKVWTGDIENKSKNGEHYFVRSMITPLFNIDGKIEQYLSIRFLITEQKKIENELKNQKILLGTILNNMPGPVYAKSLNGNYLFINKAFNDSFAVSTDKITELRDADIFSAEVTKKIAENDSLVINSKQLGNFLEIIPNTLGELRSYDTYKFPVYDADKNLIAVSGISIDITDKVKLQKSYELERAKAIQNSKLASLGEISAGIAHEINNPLTVIMGFSTVLYMFKDDEKKFNEKVQAILKSGERIAKIVRSLKKFSRTSESKVIELNSLTKIINEVVIITETFAKRHQTEIIKNIAENIIIKCDEVEIEQVLINLINNSIDAVKDLETKWIKINCFESNEKIILQIIDSGHGISADIEEKLFQPFFTTKPVGQGTGLGLSITKGILDEHNASIFVNRTFENTCFEIQFKKP